MQVAFDLYDFDFETYLREREAEAIEALKQAPPLSRRDAGTKKVVCKHWINGLCKKGDTCNFMHKYDMQRMPECYFYTKFGKCTNAECLFRHVKQDQEKAECLWYARGFCRHGPNCRLKHTKKDMCLNWLEGFCPKGKQCPLGHPVHDIPTKGPYLVPSVPGAPPSSMGGPGQSGPSMPPAAPNIPAGAMPNFQSQFPPLPRGFPGQPFPPAAAWAMAARGMPPPRGAGMPAYPPPPGPGSFIKREPSQDAGAGK